MVNNYYLIPNTTKIHFKQFKIFEKFFKNNYFKFKKSQYCLKEHIY